MMQVGPWSMRRTALLLVGAGTFWLLAAVCLLLVAVLAFGNYGAIGPEDVSPASDFIWIGLIGLAGFVSGIVLLYVAIRRHSKTSKGSGSSVLTD